ncbi:hypothetical protein [Brevibacillus laterosporus]|uniref:hypothetical protein n=1 Tax=Brevibacillus laterosporus TaxID=1465 RepID=UPI000B9A3485|nr:hypothetical protein [Brevibacillus laterosporus]MBG9790805.1 hypothetical protein [Brevibacillus laterosporus]MCG7318492.1 hypothetical protein [Brevibacillus laterosporus]MED1788694.1 hypothetical protein [Brevibacillus laterosporus]
MEYTNLLKYLAQIWVTPKENQDVEVINPTPLQLLGKGRQGAVFQLTDNICVKIYGEIQDCEREYYALSLGQHTELLPIVYERGRNYIVMEKITGINLREYLQSETLTKELSLKLIQMLVTFKEIGYERIDHHKRQIYLLPSGQLKVIDVGRTVWRDRTYPYPRKLLTSLGTKISILFLTHVKKMAPELYKEWKQYREMDNLARYIHGVISQEQLQNVENIASEATRPLLSIHDPAVFEWKLESMVRKIHKEETEKIRLDQHIRSKRFAFFHEPSYLEQKEQPSTGKKHGSQNKYVFTIQNNRPSKQSYSKPIIENQNQSNVVVLFTKL